MTGDGYKVKFDDGEVTVEPLNEPVYFDSVIFYHLKITVRVSATNAKAAKRKARVMLETMYPLVGRFKKQLGKLPPLTGVSQKSKD